MRIHEKPYDDFVEDHFPNMTLIRNFTGCRIWSAEIDEHLVVLVDSTQQRFVVFDYDSLAEREADIRDVHNLRDGGDGATGGIPARVGPKQPVRSVSGAEPTPKDDDAHLVITVCDILQ